MNYKMMAVDTGKSNITSPIYAKQGDQKSRYVNISLLNNGYHFDIPENSTAVFNVCRADGECKSFLGQIDIEKHIVTVELNSWVLTIPGIAKCDVSIICEDKKLTSSIFQINVEEAVTTDTIIQENENYDVLIELINGCSKTVSDATTATINANTAANTAINAAKRANKAADRITLPLSASDISFDNTENKLTADNIQDVVTDINVKINALYGMSEIDVSSWNNVQKIVRMGLADKVFNIGDQFVCKHGDYGELVWDVIGINFEPIGQEPAPKNLWLQLHSSLDAMLPFDLPEPLNPDEDRVENGSNRWSTSTIRMYLNSDKSDTEEWLIPNEYDKFNDTSYEEYEWREGFMALMDKDFLNVIQPVTIKTELNTVTDGGGYEETTDLFYLISRGEMYGDVDGEQQFSYYALGGSKSKPSSTNRDGFHFLRTPDINSSYHISSTYYNGSYTTSGRADDHLGIAPICCIY